MLLKIAAENILSFKYRAEFDTAPSSKSHSFEWHKAACDYTTALRLCAVYGPNGSGKSNLVKCLWLLRELVANDRINDSVIPGNLYFCLDSEGKSNPSALSIDFFTAGKVYNYNIKFSGCTVVEEGLYRKQRGILSKIFSRKDGQISTCDSPALPGANMEHEMAFVDAASRILRPDMTALAFFGKHYPQEMPAAHEAYSWITSMQVLLPSLPPSLLPHLLDQDKQMAEFINSVIPEFKTGIARLSVRKSAVSADQLHGSGALAQAITEAQRHPGGPQTLAGAEFTNIVAEQGKTYIKTLMATYITPNGDLAEMDIENESDGMRRLVAYLPMIYSILTTPCVVVIDDIELSIHPLMLKAIISKISESASAKGQLIFTSHESCLLDQSIFRPDELWIAKKDVDQSTQFYSLSEYNIHKTASIENGYLIGRYGGIPSLTSLADMKW